MYGLAYTNVDMQYTNIDTSSSKFGQVGYHAQLPRDQWVYLPVTNVVNNAAFYWATSCLEYFPHWRFRGADKLERGRN